MRDWKNFFTAEDFDGLDDNNRPRTKWLTECVAEQANVLLREELEWAPKQYGFHSDDWPADKIEWDGDEFMHTHIAHLVIEEIKGANSEFTG